MSARVLIVGGGIGGLALAGFLERRAPSLGVDLVERAPAFAPIGAGITLTGNALRLLDRLGIVERLRESGCELDGMRIADGRGRVLSELTTREESALGRDSWSTRVIAIHRAVLHEELLGAAPGARLHLATEPSAITVSDDDVTVELRHSRRDPATRAATSAVGPFDLVVGADGVDSWVRRQVVVRKDSKSSDPFFRYAGYTCWRGVVELPASTLREERASWELWGAGRRFGVVPIGGDSVYFYACVNAARGDSRYRALDPGGLRDLFDGLGGPVPEVLRGLDRASTLFHDDLGDVGLERWSRGPLVLIGDAAHASTPNLGQGAAQAIEDAAVLAGLLAQCVEAGQPLSSCLVRFESSRRGRVDRLQTMARRLGAVAQWSSAPLIALRNGLVRLTPASRARRRILDLVDEPIFEAQP